MYDAHNFEQVIDPGVCIYDAANFVTNGPTDGQADSRSRMHVTLSYKYMLHYQRNAYGNF